MPFEINLFIHSSEPSVKGWKTITFHPKYQEYNSTIPPSFANINSIILIPEKGGPEINWGWWCKRVTQRTSVCAYSGTSPLGHLYLKKIQDTQNTSCVSVTWEIIASLTRPAQTYYAKRNVSPTQEKIYPWWNVPFPILSRGEGAVVQELILWGTIVY